MAPNLNSKIRHSKTKMFDKSAYGMVYVRTDHTNLSKTSPSPHALDQKFGANFQRIPGGFPEPGRQSDKMRQKVTYIKCYFVEIRRGRIVTAPPPISENSFGKAVFDDSMDAMLRTVCGVHLSMVMLRIQCFYI